MKLVTLSLTLLATTAMSAASQLIYLGTYTPKDGASKGIYADKYDLMRRVQIEGQPMSSPVLPDYPGAVLPPRNEPSPPGVPVPFRAPGDTTPLPSTSPPKPQ